MIQTRLFTFKMWMNHQKSKQGIIWGISDELEEFGSGSYIEEFVSGGAKNYAFSVFSSTTGKRKPDAK